MGTWGTGISSNDSYADFYSDFIDMYNEGHSVPEITQRLITENLNQINLPIHAHDFWFAIANAQWECKELDRDILLRVERIITKGEDLQIWKDLNASPADLKAREKALLKFLEKIKHEKNKPRKRTKKKLYSSIFKKGDCLVYKMDNDNYGGAFVLADEEHTAAGINIIAITTINQSKKPDLKDFAKAEVCMIRDDNLDKYWWDKPLIARYWAVTYIKENIDIEVIGRLKIHNNYKEPSTFMVLPWSKLRSSDSINEEKNKIHSHPQKSIKLSKWTKWHLL